MFKANLLGFALAAFICVQSAFAVEGCDDLSKGKAGFPLQLTLQPGQTIKVQWDFTNCWVGIQNFALYANPPRACTSCTQYEFKNNIPLTMSAKNLTTGEDAMDYGKFSKSFQYADHSVIEVTLTLGASARKPLAADIQWTAGLGGYPIR